MESISEDAAASAHIGKNSGPELDLTAIAGLDKKVEKKPKRKKSAADKALEKLEKESEDFKTNQKEFKNFLDKVEHWLSRRGTKEKVLKYFQQIDPETVTFEEFKAAMLDLNVPCTSLELHTMATILDLEKTKMVHYTLLENGLEVARAHEESYEEEAVRPPLPITQLHHTPCPKCKMLQYTNENYWTMYPRYILVELLFAPFSKEEHPNHVTTLVQSHVTIAYLAHVVTKQINLLTTEIFVYDNSERNTKALQPDRRLEDDYIGGSVDHPTKVTLFYDYRSEFFDCPLLMSDYFIGLKEGHENHSMSAT